MPENCGRSVDKRLDENGRVKFVNVILVADSLVQSAEAGRNACRQLRAAAVKQISQEPSEPGHADRNSHKQILERALPSLRRSFLRNFTRCLKNGSEKMFEVISITNKSADNRK